MTESEWKSYTDPTPMLEYLRDKASERKLRLFAVACCRRIQHELLEESRQAVEVAERFADGAATLVEVNSVRRVVEATGREDNASYASVMVAAEDAWEAAVAVSGELASWAAHGVEVSLEAMGPGWEQQFGTPDAAAATERAAQASLLREIIGNPWHQTAAKTTWLTWHDGTAPKLAQSIYTDRAFDRMPILADALEDAGCTDADILNHCRGGGEHARGCWVVDAILGKK
jgi:hypothetical protein